MQIVLAARVLVTTSIQINIEAPQDDVSGDVKELGDWNRGRIDINLWLDEW
jgi:hypothetical protein